jgi:uncharacterized protein YidB (DUF937 family)
VALAYYSIFSLGPLIVIANRLRITNRRRIMGLRDILTGIQNGPRGARQPSSGGMSPLVLALLAYKAFKGRQTPAAPEQGAARGETTAAPGGGLGDILGGLFGGRSGAGPAQPGGSLNDLLRGGLGGLLGGAAAGSVLSGGLGNLIRDLQNRGHGDVAESWVRPGPNREIAPGELSDALGGDTLDALSRQTGMDRDELLEGLSQHLPEFVDQLTPQGRLPTEEEASRMV